MFSVPSIFQFVRGALLILLIVLGYGLHVQTTSYTLPSPINLQVEAVECAAYLTWEMPVISDPAGLIGYRIYRDGIFLLQLSGQDTTWLFDWWVKPGDHTYSVSAYYDLTYYGYPGFTDESSAVGPEPVQIICSGCLPFCETWDGGSLGYNEWSVFPNQGNWSVSFGQGNPTPSAMFSGLPTDTGYSYMLYNDNSRLNGGPWTCATIHFDYDIRLIDLNETGGEKLAVELYYQDMWHLMDLFSNTGSFEWESHHHEIPNGGGGPIKIRFRAFGENSADINGWYLDNICVTYSCNPPEALDGSFTGDDVSLTWRPPVCNQGSPQMWINEEIAYHDGNPDTASIESFDWVYGTLFDLSAYQYAVMLQSIDFHHSSSGATGIWKYRIHVVDWLTKTEVATIGPFFTTGDDQWEMDIALDTVTELCGFTVGIFIQPMGNTPDNAYPRISSDNSGQQGISLIGPFPYYSGLIPSSMGDYLLNLTILVPDDKLGARTVKLSRGPTDQEVEGYKVYRRNDSLSTFQKINSQPVADTSFIDFDPPLEYPNIEYYITAIFKNGSCESITSDTVEILVTTVPEREDIHLTLYPNPVSDVLHIISDQPVTSISIHDMMGKEVLVLKHIEALQTDINLSALSAGLYFVKLATFNGSRLLKISVRR